MNIAYILCKTAYHFKSKPYAGLVICPVYLLSNIPLYIERRAVVTQSHYHFIFGENDTQVDTRLPLAFWKTKSYYIDSQLFKAKRSLHSCFDIYLVPHAEKLYLLGHKRYVLFISYIKGYYIARAQVKAVR